METLTYILQYKCNLFCENLAHENGNCIIFYLKSDKCSAVNIFFQSTSHARCHLHKLEREREREKEREREIESERKRERENRENEGKGMKSESRCG